MLAFTPASTRRISATARSFSSSSRKNARCASRLYMAAVASIKWNAILGGYYRKKRADGHPHKWAIVPTMRKLLSLLNRIARDPGFIPMPEPESTKQNANVGRKKKSA